MTSKEFWEDDPSLYWSYRTFYFKQKDIEYKEKIEFMKYGAWLNGSTNHTATYLAIHNAFGKQDQYIEYPKYSEMFIKKGSKHDEKPKNKNIKFQEEFNMWARY